MKRNSGQSLIEMVVAIAIIVLVVVAIISVTTASTHNATFSRNQTLATKYCRETIEIIRSFRDQNNWQTFIANCESPPGLALLPSPFTRSIDCHQPNQPANCLIDNPTCEVTVAISWSDAQGSHKSEIKTRFTNWK